MTPTFLSLFSGIGGLRPLDLGLERSGWSCVGQVEIDPFCRRVLAKHWPDVPRWGDIREVDPDDLPRADLVAGGFPCQPVSTAGRRRAQADERWLWPEFARVVRHLRPGWVLVENVPGLLVQGMGDVLGDLAACGYDAEWDVLPAAAVGAPHLRERVFAVAYPTGDGLQRELHEPQREHDPLGWSEQPQRDGADGQMAHADDGQPHQPEGEVRAADCWCTTGRPELRAGRCGGVGSPGHVANPDGEAGGFPAGSAVAGAGSGTLPAGPPQPGRRGGHVADPNGAGRWPGSRLGWTRPTPERDGWWAAEPDVGRVAHGVPARVDRLRALGNAVVPQVAELIGRRILEAAA